MYGGRLDLIRSHHFEKLKFIALSKWNKAAVLLTVLMFQWTKDSHVNVQYF